MIEEDSQSDDAEVMRFCLRRLRYAEMVVPLLLGIVTQSDRLDQEDIDDRYKLGKQSIGDVIAKLAPELKQLEKLRPIEAVNPDLPPLKLREDPPPLVLKPDLPPLVLWKGPPPLVLKKDPPPLKVKKDPPPLKLPKSPAA